MCGKPVTKPKRGPSPKTCGQRCRKRLSRSAPTPVFPREMLDAPRWVRAAGKRPIMPSGAPASSTDPSTWSPYSAVQDGAGDGMGLGKIVEEKTGIDTRVSVLGHIQRGGSPTVEDRMKASMLGEKAALALISGASDVVFGFEQGKVVSINLFDSVNNKKTLDPELVRLARVLA